MAVECLMGSTSAKNRHNEDNSNASSSSADIAYEADGQWLTPFFMDFYIDAIDACYKILSAATSAKEFRGTLTLAYSTNHAINKSVNYFELRKCWKQLSMAHILSGEMPVIEKKFPMDAFLPEVEKRIGSD